MNFNARLAQSAKRANSWLCVGLDPDPAKFPADLSEEDTLEFCLGVVEATADVAAAVKPNAAFFEALGQTGHEALAALIERLPPGLPVILDGKRNDIGNTASKYAEATFDELGADAITVTPYLGRDTVDPFTAYEDKGVFLLCRTSNPSAKEIQDLDVGGAPFYQHMAKLAMSWNEHDNIGLVAGATWPEELATIRGIVGDGVPLLIPGVGAQGGDMQTCLDKGGDANNEFALVNVGRSIMYAGSGDDWRDEVAAAARKFV